MSVNAMITVSSDWSARSSSSVNTLVPSFVEGAGRAGSEVGVGVGGDPGSYCASMRARSSSVPCEIGPLNHLFAETSHQPPTRRIVPPTASGA